MFGRLLVPKPYGEASHTDDIVLKTNGGSIWSNYIVKTNGFVITGKDNGENIVRVYIKKALFNTSPDYQLTVIAHNLYHGNYSFTFAYDGMMGDYYRYALNNAFYNSNTTLVQIFLHE